MPAPDWLDLRQQILFDPTVTYLNTGSYGLLPKRVFEELAVLRERMFRDPVDFLWRSGLPKLWEARERTARFLNVEPRQLIFTANVSASINIVASALRLAAPGEVLTTNHEYGAMKWVWERAAARQGLVLRGMPLPVQATTPEEVAAAIVREFRPETRLLFLSHVYYTTGLVLPLPAICAEARRRGILTLIDGAHAPGMLPLDLRAVGADFYAANLHKWLLAPLGAGFLHVAPGREDLLQPLQVSWGWHYDRKKAHERDEFGGTPWLRSFEFEGSRDITPWLALSATLDFHQRLGIAAIRQRHFELSERVRQKLDGLAGLRCITPAHPELRGGLTSFLPPPHEPLAVRAVLWGKHRIEHNLVEHPESGNFLRISTHFYNTEEEIDRLANVIPEAFAQ